METNIIKTRLIALLKKNYNFSTEFFSSNIRMEDLGIDSFSKMEILALIENEFYLKLKVSDVLKVNTFDDLILVLKNKL